MTKLAYRIAKLKELRRLKEASGVHLTPVIATFTPDPPDTIQEEKAPPLSAQTMPKSLEGLNKLDLLVLFTDGQMDETESRWYQSKCIPDQEPLDKNYWMQR